MSSGNEWEAVFPDDVHWRLYAHPERGLVVVCVQWFDYFGYDRERFIGDRYDSEAAAELACESVRTEVLLHRLALAQYNAACFEAQMQRIMDQAKAGVAELEAQ